MSKKWKVFVTSILCAICFTSMAHADNCELCGGDKICDTCKGLGYQIMTAYDTNEYVRVNCTAGCNAGHCPECYVPCEICDSDELCNMCSGLGYLTMKAYGTNEEILVVCTGDFCANGFCTACQTVNNELDVERTETVVTEYSTTGFQTIKMAIELDAAGKIVSVNVIEHNETPGFGADLLAEGFEALIGQNITKAQIDIKAGVTMTSNGINDALKQAAAAYSALSSEAIEEETIPQTDVVVYEVKGFQKIKVTIEIDEAGKIVSVAVIEHNETPGFGADLINDGFDVLVGQDIATAKIDIKAGVTMTSNAINDALKQAAAASGFVENDDKGNEQEKNETDEEFFSKMTKYTAGQYKVGIDIPAGEYVLLSTGSTSGYFSVSSDANGDNILFNDNFQVNSIIEVRNGEYVELKRCVAVSVKEFYSQYSIDEDNYGVMLKVGYDIWPGEYKLVTEFGKSGYYCIYNDARHNDIVSNDNFDNSSYVMVEYGQYLLLSRCKIKN